MPQPLTAFLKKYLLPLILVSGLILFFATGLHNWLSFTKLAENYGAIKSYIAMNQAQAYGLFFLIYLIAVAFSLPIASLLTLAGGALLGWTGAALILVSATAGAAIVFIAARSVMADFLSAKAGPFLKKLEAGFSENAFHYLLALRLVPIAPFWVVNIVPALLGMRLMPFVSWQLHPASSCQTMRASPMPSVRPSHRLEVRSSSWSASVSTVGTACWRI